MIIRNINKNTLLVIVGPTGIGKTKLSFYLGNYFDTHIISCDSRKFYKEINIGTNTPYKYNKIFKNKIYFINNKSIIDTNYNCNEFSKDAINIINNIIKKRKIVIMSGGSIMYEKSVIDGLDIFPKCSNIIRKYSTYIFNKYGINYLQNIIKILDPKYYNIVDIYNHRRLIRALEVIIVSNEHKYSIFLKKKKKKHKFNIIKIGLILPNNELFRNINNRVDNMINNGLLNEAINVYKYKNDILNSTIGYKEFFEFIEKKKSYNEVINNIKINTIKLAKKQLKWYKKDNEIVWFSPKEYNKIKNYVINRII